MPIDTNFTFHSLSVSEMRELDYAVMAQAHASQNELGRLCDEKIYQADLAERLKSIGLKNSYTEVPLKVAHKDFSMMYFLDLVVEDKAIYEIKACSSLHPAHTAQLLNYLFLCNSPRGKLINFRPSAVESRYVNSPFSTTKRQTFEMVTSQWHGEDHFIELIAELLKDWGTGLELSLYRKALIHLLGGEQVVTRPLPLTRKNIPLGHQVLNLYSPNTAISITAFSQSFEQHLVNLRKMLVLTKIDQFYWVNIAMGKVEFRTVTV